MKNDDFLETWKCWFSIVIYSIFELSGRSKVDKNGCEKSEKIWKMKHATKTRKSMKFGGLARSVTPGLRQARRPSEHAIWQNLSKNSEHALHPAGGGGSKRFAHAAAPFSSPREAWGIGGYRYIGISSCPAGNPRHRAPKRIKNHEKLKFGGSGMPGAAQNSKRAPKPGSLFTPAPTFWEPKSHFCVVFLRFFRRAFFWASKAHFFDFDRFWGPPKSTPTLQKPWKRLRVSVIRDKSCFFVQHMRFENKERTIFHKMLTLKNH